MNNRNADISGRKTYPLLSSQTGVFLSWLSHKERTDYNLPSAIWYSKEVDADRLASALEIIISQRKELHIRLFRGKDGELRQWADMEMDIDVVRKKMNEEEAKDYIYHRFVRSFDLLGGEPLCRFEIVETEAHNILLIDLHHVIGDGITLSHILLGQDLRNTYAGQDLDIPQVGMFELAVQEQEDLSGLRYEDDKQYFDQLFSDCETPRLDWWHSDGSQEMSSFTSRISKPQIKAFSQAHGIREYHLFLTAFSIVLSKLSYSRRFVFTTLSHGRRMKQLHSAYGMFVRTIPLMADIEHDIAWTDLCHGLQHQLIGSLRHYSYPYIHFCRDHHITPGISFSFQGDEIKEQSVIDGVCYPGEQLPKDMLLNDLGCTIYDKDSEYELRFDGQIDSEMLERMCMSMQRCLEKMMELPDGKVSEIELLDSAELSKMMEFSEGEKVDIDYNETIVEKIQQQSLSSPDKMAVSDGVRSLSYRELTESAEIVAGWLRDEGAQSGDFIGVLAVPCPEYVCCVMGIMKCGCAFVPLDLEQPESRIKAIMDDADIRIALDPREMGIYRGRSAFDALKVSPDAPAYMMYTSGSTGKPKGVVIPHRGLLNHSLFIARRWGLDSSSRIACHSPLSFDASIEDLFPVLTVGGTLYIMPSGIRKDLESIYRYIEANKITGGCYSTHTGLLLSRHFDLHVDYLCLGGERLTRIPPGDFKKYNTYGPTEFTVNATYHEISESDSNGNIPIGRPVDNCFAYVLDPYGRMVPQGFAGELCLSGPQCALGYHNDDEQTRKRFRYNEALGKTVYHTGDLVRWNSEGELEYLDREDRQFKIDGHRVECGEIESAMCRIEGVEQSVVIFDKSGSRHAILAYYTGVQSISIQRLKDGLSSLLPSYMIPHRFIYIDEFPISSNGKVDMSQLQELGFSEAYIAPADSTEELLCQVFAKVLMAEKIGVTDNFFEHGGSSLNAMEAVVVAKEAGLSISYSDIYEYPTPRVLAEHVKDKTSGGYYDVSDHDYTNIHRFLREHSFSAIQERQADGYVLLTGGSGFLGIHILKRLLEETSFDVVCMLRCDDAEKGLERLETAWRTNFQEPFENKERVIVIAGDIGESKSFEGLANYKIHTVINSAAYVKYFCHDGELERSNIQGVENVVGFCQSKGIRLIHISTTSVEGLGYEGGEDSLFFHGQKFLDQYSWSKFIGERIILEKVAGGCLDAQIIRLAYLTKGDKGSGQLLELLTDMHEKGVLPSGFDRQAIAKQNVDDAAGEIVKEAFEGGKYEILRRDIRSGLNH